MDNQFQPENAARRQPTVEHSVGQQGPRLVETFEQARVRSQTIGTEQQIAAELALQAYTPEHPSTMRQNMMGAGADFRGITDEEREEEAEQLSREHRLQQGNFYSHQ